METIGSRIKAAREEAKISAVGLASKCGVTRQAVYQWQDDKTIPTADNILTISDLTGWSIRRLLRGDLQTADVSDAVDPRFVAVTTEERMLLSDFREAPAAARKAARAALLVEQVPHTAIAAGGVDNAIGTKAATKRHDQAVQIEALEADSEHHISGASKTIGEIMGSHGKGQKRIKSSKADKTQDG